MRRRAACHGSWCGQSSRPDLPRCPSRSPPPRRQPWRLRTTGRALRSPTRPAMRRGPQRMAAQQHRRHRNCAGAACAVDGPRCRTARPCLGCAAASGLGHRGAQCARRHLRMVGEGGCAVRWRLPALLHGRGDRNYRGHVVRRDRRPRRCHRPRPGRTGRIAPRRHRPPLQAWACCCNVALTTPRTGACTASTSPAGADRSRLNTIRARGPGAAVPAKTGEPDGHLASLTPERAPCAANPLLRPQRLLGQNPPTTQASV